MPRRRTRSTRPWRSSPPRSRRARRTSRKMRALASTRRACSRKPCKTASSRMAARSARARAVGAGQKGRSRRFSFGNANIWARGADQFGSATAPLRAPAWLRHQPRGPAHRRRRLAPRQRHRGGCRRDLCRDLGEVQGRLEHQCELVSRRALTPAGPAGRGTPWEARS